MLSAHIWLSCRVLAMPSIRTPVWSYTLPWLHVIHVNEYVPLVESSM